MNYVTTDVVTYVPEYTYTTTRSHKIDWWLVFLGLMLVAMGVYFFHRYSILRKLKKRCTQLYSAEITQIRKSTTADPHLRSKHMQYNATYRYEYNGQYFECNNNIYGYYGFKKPKVGDKATIYIDPDEPSVLFDDFAKDRLRSFFIIGIMMVGTGGFVVFADIFTNLFQ